MSKQINEHIESLQEVSRETGVPLEVVVQAAQALQLQRIALILGLLVTLETGEDMTNLWDDIPKEWKE